MCAQTLQAAVLPLSWPAGPTCFIHSKVLNKRVAVTLLVRREVRAQNHKLYRDQRLQHKDDGKVEQVERLVAQARQSIGGQSPKQGVKKDEGEGCRWTQRMKVSCLLTCHCCA